MTIEITNGSPIGSVFYITNDVIIGSDKSFGKDVYFIYMKSMSTKVLISKETFNNISEKLRLKTPDIISVEQLT